MSALTINKNKTVGNNIINTWWNGFLKTINPVNIMHDLTNFRVKEWIMLTLMLASQAVAFIFGADYSVMGWIGLITGVFTILSLILCDRGRITNYFFGFIGCAIWLVIAIHNRLIGDIFSQSFYIFMNLFYGIYAWNRALLNDVNTNDDNNVGSNEIKPRKMTRTQAVIAFILSIIAYFIIVYISHKANGNLIWLDAALLPLGVCGQILMSLGYRSQWIAWIIVDIVNVIIWSLRLADGGAAASSMLILQIAMLINAIYGCWLWFHTGTSTETIK